MEKTWSALIVVDDPAIRKSLRLCLEAENARVLGVGTLAGALEALERGRFHVVFLDMRDQSALSLASLSAIGRCQPGISVIVMTAFANSQAAVEAMRRGAVNYLLKPFTAEQVRNVARQAVAAAALQRQLSEARASMSDMEGDFFLETQNAAYHAFLHTALRVAESDSVVLLRGESGTGKTVLARWMWAHSKRADRSFVTIHCPMLSSDLMSSTLFGHVKGAFTGAVSDSVGKVEEAENGTLFLDEVGDLTADTQARLLRFLHDRTYERLGEAKERKADVRIIAATNRRLEDEVKAGRFREDLFFRLNVIALTIPRLRERPEDVLPLARHYLHFFEERQGLRNLSFSLCCQNVLANYSWPGNLRELRNAVERATILAPGYLIEAEDLGLPWEVMSQSMETGSDAPVYLAPKRAAVPVLGGNVTLEEIEREHLARVVARASSFEAAARILGIDATTLQRKRKRYGLA
jgi:NtrC-family two-component system response regulator AlgB